MSNKMPRTLYNLVANEQGKQASKAGSKPRSQQASPRVHTIESTIFEGRRRRPTNRLRHTVNTPHRDPPVPSPSSPTQKRKNKSTSKATHIYSGDSSVG